MTPNSSDARTVHATIATMKEYVFFYAITGGQHLSKRRYKTQRLLCQLVAVLTGL